MISLKDEGIILERTDNEFENQAVLNPACIEKDGIIHMFYRAVRNGNFSTIGACRLQNNRVVERSDEPVLFPEYEYEKHGLEDPRIVCLDGLYYMTYTAYDGKNARVAYAVSEDLKRFEKKGLISPDVTYDMAEDLFKYANVKEKYVLFEAFYKEERGKNVMLWEKDTFLFPKKIGGQFALVHRILPGIQIAFFNKFSDLTYEYWKDYFSNLGEKILLDPKYWFESECVGGGCPPIETDKGWLFIYHGVEDNGIVDKVYRTGAALLDKENPMKVLGRLDSPLFSPEKEYEKNGDVNNVVFPTGAVVKDGKVFIYYGAADKLIACKSVDVNELLEELLKKPVQIPEAVLK